MNSLVKPLSKKAKKKMRATVALLAKQQQRQEAAASEAQAEASLALECDKPLTRSTGDGRTAKEADRVQAEVQRWRAESDLDYAKRGFVGGRWAHVGGAGPRGAGNLRIVSMDTTRPRGAIDADLGIVATKRLSAPPASFWKAAKNYRTSPGWSRGQGAHGLAPRELRSIVEYQGEILSQSQLSSALSGLSERQVLRTHVKLFVRQYGTPTEAAGLVVSHAINPHDVREKVRVAMARRDETLLSRLGLGCLSNSTYPHKRKANMATVLDGPQMFLVPLRDIEVGEELTHYYNVDSLIRHVRGG